MVPYDTCKYNVEYYIQNIVNDSVWCPKIGWL